jgi:hypothetical protein
MRRLISTRHICTVLHGHPKRLPIRCPLAPENGHFPEEIRQLLYGTRRDAFHILFTIQSDTVHVFYIRHRAQRYLRQDET